MNTISIILALGTGAIIGVAVMVFGGILGNLRTKPIVLAVLKDGTTIRGALLKRRPSYITLGGAELLENGKATPIDGTTYIDRPNILWIQEPGT